MTIVDPNGDFIKPEKKERFIAGKKQKIIYYSPIAVNNTFWIISDNKVSHVENATIVNQQL